MKGFHRWGRNAQVFDPCVILKPEKIEIGAHSRIDSFSKVEGGQGVSIGEFVHVASFCHLNIGGGRLILEDHCTLSSHVCVASATPDWSYLYVSASEPSEHRHTKRYITRICSFAALFTGAIVVPGVTVGEGAIVKPGSVVLDDVKPWDIVEGNPARPVGKRKIQSGYNESNRGLLLSQFEPIYP